MTTDVPTALVPAGKGPVTKHQKMAVAKMAASGLPLDTIAQSIGRSKASVSRLLQEDPEVQQELEVVQSRLMKTMALHHMDMMSKLDQAREVIDQGLHNQDVRIALDTSKWLIEHTVPKGAQRIEVEFSGETKHTVQTAAVNISAQLNDLLTSLNAGPTTNFEESIKDELPGPQSMESARKPQ